MKKKLKTNLSAYRKPGPMGGTLIRRVVKFFRDESLLNKGETYPGLLVACSGGSDSTALAVLLTRYGRRIVAPGGITLLHVNHGWRGEESDGDSRFVADLARRLGVKAIRFKSKRLPKKGESWEDAGRKLRKRLFERALTRAPNAAILTGHTKNDLFETKIWRFFTGVYETQGEGILTQFKGEVRPLLDVTKQELQTFLKEEGISWREDASNQDPRFLRNRLRNELIPVVDQLFPGALESVCRKKP
jgi:tRNA(Ile)-lysidine synthase